MDYSSDRVKKRQMKNENLKALLFQVALGHRHLGHESAVLLKGVLSVVEEVAKVKR